MTSTASAPSFERKMAPSTTAPRRRLLVDAPTRVFHWMFALSFAGAYATAESEHWRLLHVTLGYTMAGLLGFRLLYGLAGPRQAGLGILWRRLAGLPAWIRSLGGGEGTPMASRQGQNLLMSLAIGLLLVLVAPLTLSGYAVYNDWGGRFLGEVFEETHEFLGQAMLMVALAHLALIAGLSLFRRRNLAGPMLTGRSVGSGPDLVRKNHAWLAVLLTAAVAAFWMSQWQSAPRDQAASTARQHDRDD